MDILNFWAGLANYALFVLLVSYMTIQVMRKNKLSNFTWVGLCKLAFLTFLIGTSFVFFANYESDYCSFGLHMVFGIDSILVFNLINQVGYKLYFICRNIYEFVKSGNLPN